MPRHLLIIAAMLLLALTPAFAQAEDKPQRILVMDTDAAFSRLEERKAILADNQAKIEEIQKELAARAKKIEALQGELEAYKEGSDAHAAKEKELLAAIAEHDAWIKVEQRNVNAEIEKRLNTLREKMTAAIAAIAEENNADLVIPKTIRVPVTRPDGQTQLMTIHNVLWSAENTDITEQVITRLNNEYNAAE